MAKKSVSTQYSGIGNVPSGKGQSSGKVREAYQKGNHSAEADIAKAKATGTK